MCSIGNKLWFLFSEKGKGDFCCLALLRKEGTLLFQEEFLYIFSEEGIFKLATLRLYMCYNGLLCVFCVIYYLFYHLFIY